MDVRKPKWGPSVCECVSYLRTLISRFLHINLPGGFVFEDASLQYLLAAPKLWVHCDANQTNNYFKALSYLGGSLNDDVFADS